MAADVDLLLERIRALISVIDEGADVPRSDVERTVTDGYAQALLLDGDCLRLEERIDMLTRLVADGREMPPGTLSSLLSRLQETEERSVELRETLAPLRELVAAAA